MIESQLVENTRGLFNQSQSVLFGTKLALAFISWLVEEDFEMVFAISFVCLGFFSALISGQQLGMLIKGMAMGSRLYVISINLLVVYRESVNLIGYITRRLSADSLRQVVARVILFPLYTCTTLFQTWISTHGANNSAPRLNLMNHNETVLFYALLDIFFSFTQWDYELIYTKTIWLLTLVFYER